MFVACDSDGNKVSINNAKDGRQYYCPFCGSEVFTRKRKGAKKHFVHKANSDCPDSNRRPKSAWHLNWQNRFPVNNQEEYFVDNGDEHFADVAIGDLVLEFQHSSIKRTDIEERTDFYRRPTVGKQVIWVFHRPGQLFSEVLHIWNCDETPNKYSGYFSFPDYEKFLGAIKSKDDIIAIDYDDAVFVMSNWQLTSELSVDGVFPNDDDYDVNNELLNLACDVSIMGYDTFVEMCLDRAKSKWHEWSFREYIQKNERKLFNEACSILEEKYLIVSFADITKKADACLNKYILFSMLSRYSDEICNFFTGTKNVFIEQIVNFDEFITYEFFDATFADSSAYFEPIKDKIFQEYPENRAFALETTLQVKKVELRDVLFWLFLQLPKANEKIYFSTSLTFARVKDIPENAKRLEAVRSEKERLAKEEAERINAERLAEAARKEAERIAHEKKLKEELKRKEKILEAQRRKLRELAKQNFVRKNGGIVVPEAFQINDFRYIPFCPRDLSDTPLSLDGLSPLQKKVAFPSFFKNLPEAFPTHMSRETADIWRYEMSSYFPEDAIEVSLDGLEFHILENNVLMHFFSSDEPEEDIAKRISVAKKNRKVFWRIFNCVGSSVTDILAINRYGRISPYFAVNEKYFVDAQIEKKNDVILLCFGSFRVLLTGWQPIWKVISSATNKDKITTTSKALVSRQAPFTRTSLKESISRTMDDSGKRGNLASVALVFPNEFLFQFLQDKKYTAIERKDVTKFVEKHPDVVADNIRSVFSDIYTNDFLENVLSKNNKYSLGMSSFSRIPYPYVYLSDDFSSWTSDFLAASFQSDSLRDFLDSIPDNIEYAANVMSHIGDIHSLELCKTDWNKILHYLVSRLLTIKW